MNVTIVHNGTIENNLELCESLESSVYEFRSYADSEVLANLLQRYYDITNDARAALISVVADIRGQYAFVVMFADGTLVGARQGKPLILGISGGDLFLSSDVLGFVEHTDQAVYLESGTV